LATTTTTTTRSLAAVILAAGKGKRLKSARPKVLHPVCGKPALWHVVQTALAARPDRIVVVVAHDADDVRAAVASWKIMPKPVFVEQTRQLGTGHAVLAAKSAVGRVDDVLVANGDFDPVLPDDIRALLRRHRRVDAVVTIASTDLRDPGTYQRIVRDGRRVIEVVEGTDAPTEIRRINEVGTNWMAFRRGPLFAALPKVRRNNRQHEYYLNDAVSILLRSGARVEAVLCDTGGTLGLNSRGGLAAVIAVVRGRINAKHLDTGVTLLDPGATYIDVDVRIGRDSTIYPNVLLEGSTVIGRDCAIGPSDRGFGDRRPQHGAVRGDPRIDRRQGCRRGALRPDASGRGDGGRFESGCLRRSEGRPGRSRVEGAAPVVRGRCRTRGGREHRSGHGDDQLRRLWEAPDGDRGRSPDRFRYHARCACSGRSRRGDRCRFRDHERRPAGVARRRADRAADRPGLPGAQGRGAPPRHEEALSVEIMTKKRMMLYSGTIHPTLAHEIADNLGIPVSEGEIRRFASGEIYFRAEESVRGADVFVVQTHYEPVNEAIVEQLIMIDAMKRASAKRITAVVPYYGYSRQDKKAVSREAISAKLVADLLCTAGANRCVSVDLHSGQIQGFFDAPFDHLTALPLLSSYLKDSLGLHGDDVVVVAPDAGRIKTAEKLREYLHADLAFLYKRRSRTEAHKIEEMTVVGEVDGRPCVLVDDMIDTAATLTEGVKALAAMGAGPIFTGATHALFSGKARQHLEEAPIDQVIVTNTVPIPEEKQFPKLRVLSIAPLIASALRAVFEDTSVSEIFGGANQV
jgi:ribose-phosphate pyrophosphokinase